MKVWADEIGEKEVSDMGMIGAYILLDHTLLKAIFTISQEHIKYATAKLDTEILSCSSLKNFRVATERECKPEKSTPLTLLMFGFISSKRRKKKICFQLFQYVMCFKGRIVLGEKIYCFF